MVAESPVEPSLLAQLLEVSPTRVEELCAELEAAYRDEDRGFELVRVAGGYRFQSHADLAPYVERFLLEGQTARLSAAALETLAIVAYKQPVSRAQIAQIRGVNAESATASLLERGSVEEAGRSQFGAVLYRTTPLFLKVFDLQSLDELPDPAEWDASPEEQGELRDRLLAAGDARSGMPAE